MQISFITVNKPMPPHIELEYDRSDAPHSTAQLIISGSSKTSTYKVASSATETPTPVSLINGAINLPISGTTGKVFIFFEDEDYSPNLSGEFFFPSSSGFFTAVKNWAGIPFKGLRLGSQKLTEVPNTLWEKCTTLDSMFLYCWVFNQSLPWDTKNITSMRAMFQQCKAYNRPINFDTQNVTSMQSMFSACPVFNSPITFSNVNKVTTIEQMFATCSAFNQDLSGLVFKASTNRAYYDIGVSGWNSAFRPKFNG